MTQKRYGLHNSGAGLLLLLIGLMGSIQVSLAGERAEESVEQKRLETMRAHVAAIEFRASEPKFPLKLTDQPLFRYDDLARGYVDGTVWRLGDAGRPRAIVTAELHPKYSGEPRIVYDYLSLSDIRFTAQVAPGIAWNPSGTAIDMKSLPDGPNLAATKSQRLFQLKKMAERFTAQQTVEGEELELRLLPRPIDRYRPSDQDDSDAAIFLFVSGRNPGILLVIEATDSRWEYGAGRLSGPSTLTLALDGQPVWGVSPATYSWQAPYTATNFAITIPGVEHVPSQE
jgi:hypothetical protein